MTNQPHISRRHVLVLSAAAGGAAASSLGAAWAQQRPRREFPAEVVLTPRIDRLDPALDKIISTSETIREIASGFGGPLGPAEGPLWWKEGGYLLFSDINASKRMKYTPGQGVMVFQENTHQANGLTRDLQGRLLACEHETRRVTRQEHDGSITVIANSFQGRRLNRPNDVIVKSDGSIYFTDPWSSPLAPEQWDLPYSGVYRVTPDLGTITLLLDDMVFPNGLAFSPDESVIYIDDFRRGHIRAFDLAPNGTLAKQSDRLFADLTGPEPGGPDGMKVDSAGNVYCGGAGGIYILDPTGKKLGRIVHGQPATTNIGFGGDDLKTLFFTSRSHLGSVHIKIAGIPAPPPKKT
ncbi:MAG TPA: SMP-30/gluconolactonase/LRE family protein [Xanthobacteraceae bacterium]|nr:SMP-30/gluconolactonase/LRE family protein [Xanthobacteraceae bacterium]